MLPIEAITVFLAILAALATVLFAAVQWRLERAQRRWEAERRAWAVPPDLSPLPPADEAAARRAAEEMAARSERWPSGPGEPYVAEPLPEGWAVAKLTAEGGLFSEN